MKSFFKSLLLVFLFSITIFFWSGCRKYPDGPTFSLIPKNYRLEEDWKKSKVYENGADITSRALAHFAHESFNIDHQGGFSYSLVTDNGSSISYAGSWSFSSDKTVIYFTYALGAGVNTDRFLILRLREDDMWFQTADASGNVMEYHFVPN
jgi:hypothetical protein